MKVNFIIVLLIIMVTKSVAQVCDYENSVELTNRMYNGIKYEDGEYFVDSTTGVERGCVCMKKICIQKCCPFGQGFDSVKDQCADLQKVVDPPVNENADVVLGFNVSKEFHILINRNLSCTATENYVLHSSSNILKLQKDGRLFVGNDDYSQQYDREKFCLDNFLLKTEDDQPIIIKLHGFVCHPDEENSESPISNVVCMLISCFFIILTIAVYMFLPEFRTTHGMVMTMYLLCFFVGFLLMVSMQILLLLKNIDENTCIVMTFAIYFWILAGFFWLNVMCYDVWSKLRLIAAPNINRNKKFQAKKFLLYCCYAFGMSSGLTIILAALEFFFLPKTHLLRPRRQETCFLSDTSRLLYLYTPIIVLWMADLVFFVLTAKNIADTTRRARVLEGRRRKERRRFLLYIKLFILAGLTWILEVASYLLPQADYLWQLTDAYNSLTGVFVFVIFICKTKVLTSVRRRFSEFRSSQLTRLSTRTTNTALLRCRPEHQRNLIRNQIH